MLFPYDSAEDYWDLSMSVRRSALRRGMHPFSPFSLAFLDFPMEEKELCSHRVFENILLILSEYFKYMIYQFNNNGEPNEIFRRWKRDPPSRQKQFQERREWIFSHACLRHAYSLNDSVNNRISAANLPGVLRAVEDNERRQPSAEDIKLWLCNNG